MKFNFVVFATNVNLFKYMYQDMPGLENVVVFWDKNELLELLPPVIRKLAQQYVSTRMNKVFKLPLKKLWYFLALRKIKFANENPICFVWHHHFITEIENRMVEYIRKIFPDSKHLYFYTDPWTVNSESVKYMKSKMDIVGVFDPGIAYKYDISYFPNVYPNENSKENFPIEYDICFVGHDKGREKELYEIAQSCKKNHLRTAFFIGRKEGEERREGIQYCNKKIPYKDVVELTKRSKCILELKVEPDHTCSLRVQEAVVLNKWLLTNNENVRNMPCCADSKYVQYFEKTEEIDWDFLKSNEIVDYNYQGEFSAKRWLQRIEEELIVLCHTTNR